MKIKDLKLLLSDYDEELDIKFPSDYESSDHEYFSDILNIRCNNSQLYLSALSDETYHNIKYSHEDMLILLEELQDYFYKLYPNEHCFFAETYYSYNDDFTYYFYYTINKLTQEFYDLIREKVWNNNHNIQLEKLEFTRLIYNINQLREHNPDIIHYHICVENNWDGTFNIFHNYNDSLSRYFDSKFKVVFDDFNNVRINNRAD